MRQLPLCTCPLNESQIVVTPGEYNPRKKILEEEIDKLKEDLKAVELKIELQKKTYQKFQIDIKEQEEQVNALKVEKGKLEVALENTNDEINRLNKEINRLQNVAQIDKANAIKDKNKFLEEYEQLAYKNQIKLQDIQSIDTLKNKLEETAKLLLHFKSIAEEKQYQVEQLEQQKNMLEQENFRLNQSHRLQEQPNNIHGLQPDLKIQAKLDPAQVQNQIFHLQERLGEISGGQRQITVTKEQSLSELIGNTSNKDSVRSYGQHTKEQYLRKLELTCSDKQLLIQTKNLQIQNINVMYIVLYIDGLRTKKHYSVKLEKPFQELTYKGTLEILTADEYYVTIYLKLKDLKNKIEAQNLAIHYLGGRNSIEFKWGNKMNL
ncbi:hypothetical protein FGO68_gene5138 [Halteria grandinella]|uniref:Uncharacterized protein n=1 Tax=Halteria grandinella TaxID=5974 RepID=A0A8J8SXS4_HALGN|nr:hypothetical protein FGO68_gene5138 [Halteria grandinella]